jgi:hypothetical protein
MTVESFIIDATLRLWNKTEGIWVTYINDDFFVAANETQDFIAYHSYLDSSPLFFTIPTPINLTMIGEYAVSTGYHTNFSVNSNELTLQSTFGFIFIATFNSDGILTRFTMEIASILVIIVELGTGGDDAIPYGYFFMIFTLLGVISIIYLEKRKTK